MYFIHAIAEAKIKEAEHKGDFENLSCSGRPIEYEDDSMIPPDLRMAYKALKNAGYLPPEMQLRKDIHSALDLLEHMEDEKERYKQIQKVNLLLERVKNSRGMKISIDEEDTYYKSIVERITLHSNKSKG
ncbi:DnaJ family domain-containing protein [Maridesulfovibrio zosterae]|uniref:DnaJ family domain-containing protein n=1 Tax=Maridesulfovibrio zosterae TaxID=82171 RepID=UPI000408CAC9|nr:DnaJ family domain-containing protein [Maridesulfovibrio zosterae]